MKRYTQSHADFRMVRREGGDWVHADAACSLIEREMNRVGDRLTGYSFPLRYRCSAFDGRVYATPGGHWSKYAEVLQILREIAAQRPHAKDSDCTVVDGWCIICGAEHGEGCETCGGRGFHWPACPDGPDVRDWGGPGEDGEPTSIAEHAGCGYPRPDDCEVTR